METQKKISPYRLRWLGYHSFKVKNRDRRPVGVSLEKLSSWRSGQCKAGVNRHVEWGSNPQVFRSLSDCSLMVEHVVWDHGGAGSNPAGQT